MTYTHRSLTSLSKHTISHSSVHSGHQARASLEGLHRNRQGKGHHCNPAIDHLSFLRHTRQILRYLNAGQPPGTAACLSELDQVTTCVKGPAPSTFRFAFLRTGARLAMMMVTNAPATAKGAYWICSIYGTACERQPHAADMMCSSSIMFYTGQPLDRNLTNTQHIPA